MNRHFLIPALLSAGLLSQEAPAFAQAGGLRATPPGPPCLRQRNIYDFQLVPGNRSLIVIDVARQRYRLNFMGKCYDIQHQFGLRFKSFGVGTLSCIAKGDSVLLHDPVGPGTCIVQSVQYQTPDLDRADTVSLSLAADGSFSVKVPPGSYTLTARSSQINGGKDLCARPRTVHAGLGDFVQVNLICDIP